MLNAMANARPAPLLRIVPPLASLPAPARDSLERADAHVARALAAMMADPTRRWTVAALGRVVGLSRAALARRFTTALGVPPLRWLADHRLGLAKLRLVETELSLAAIAGDVGYRCEFAFAKAFKRRVGLPPGVFRRLARAARTARVPGAAPVFRAAA
jgi:transcriptional regulator GlxA family with amidase domain